jgi:hypothetical protein
MTRFTIGLLLGLLLGIAAAVGFLITEDGGDYFVSASPRIRELDSTLKTVVQERELLQKRLDEANASMARLESRFIALSDRFESLGAMAQAGSDSRGSGGSVPTPEPTTTPPT